MESQMTIGSSPEGAPYASLCPIAQSMAMEPMTIFEKDDGAGFALLPRSVRLLAPPAEARAFCEFEVVTGNAAYREGERFYLTRAKAQRAYPAAPLPPRNDVDAP
jgi:hypothetical protein